MSGAPPARVIAAPPATESAAQLEAVFQSALDGIVVIDGTGIIETLNPATERMFGYPAAELVGRNVSTLMPEPYRHEHDGYLARYLRTGQRRTVGIGREVLGRRRDGSVFPMDLAVNEMRIGEQRKFMGLLRDISERKRQFDELAAARASAARFRVLVESIEDYGIVMLDPDGRVASWNAGAARIKGYAAEEIIGRHYEAFYPLEERAAGTPARVLADAGQHGRLESEGWRVRKDGSRFWASVALKALRDGAGVLTGYAKVTRDLTERRRAEAALRDREVRLRTLVETTADGIIVFNTHGRIESFNAAAERLFGYRAAEVRNRDVRLLCAEALGPPGPSVPDLTALMEALRAATAARRKDGTVFPMEVAVSAMTIAEQRLATAIVRDVTARKRAEEELRGLNESLAAQVAETRRMLQRLQETQAQLIQTEKLASLGGMVAGVAHEINTPLGVSVTAASAVELWVRELREKLAAGTLGGTEAGRLLTSIGEGVAATLRNLERAAGLVHSFKEIAVDQTSEQRRRIRLRDYINEVLTSLAPRLRAGGCTVRLECPIDLVVDTYPGALAQILTNLAVNSTVHAYPHGGGGRIEVTVRSEAGGVRLEYRDDGIGIPPQHLPRVFDPFFTTRRGSGGSGLGLHIVHNLATQLLGGTITVASEPGRGAEFVVRLPPVAPERPAVARGD